MANCNHTVGAICNIRLLDFQLHWILDCSWIQIEYKILCFHNHYHSIFEVLSYLHQFAHLEVSKKFICIKMLRIFRFKLNMNCIYKSDEKITIFLRNFEHCRPYHWTSISSVSKKATLSPAHAALSYCCHGNRKFYVQNFKQKYFKLIYAYIIFQHS